MARVLVVEDNSANMKLTVLLLEKAGHTALQAFDGETGVMLARGERPDLILMDIHLPGMDGLSATRILKADPATRGITIVALTGMAMKGDEERILEAGCDAYIAKPLRYESFMARLSQALARE